jgi:hypothetical protein
MTVEQLLKELAVLPSDATVHAVEEAGCFIVIMKDGAQIAEFEVAG